MFYRAEKLGYIMNVGAELEFYYFPDERTPEPMDKVGYFDLTPSDSARDLRRSTVLMLEKMSIPVEYTFHSSVARSTAFPCVTPRRSPCPMPS